MILILGANLSDFRQEFCESDDSWSSDSGMATAVYCRCLEKIETAMELRSFVINAEATTVVQAVSIDRLNTAQRVTRKLIH